MCVPGFTVKGMLLINATLLQIPAIFTTCIAEYVRQNVTKKEKKNINEALPKCSLRETENKKNECNEFCYLVIV